MIFLEASPLNVTEGDVITICGEVVSTGGLTNTSVYIPLCPLFGYQGHYVSGISVLCVHVYIMGLKVNVTVHVRLETTAK